MRDDTDKTCRRNCWLIAALGGGLLALLLMLLARYPFRTALVIGIVFCAAGGVFLTWAFCTGRKSEAAAESRRQSAPAPVPAPPPAPAQPAPEPVAAMPAAEPAAVEVQAGPSPAPKAPRVVKPRAKAARPAGERPASKTAPRKPAATTSAGPRAAGLDAAMDKSKDAAAAPRSQFLPAPRGGRGDDLKLIRGVGPALETLLNGIGVWHFDQIAAWKAKDIALVDGRMEGFKGRITRDEWVKQARVLAKGGKV